MSVNDFGGDPIDVVVPVYNAIDDLKRCIESVLACTNHNYRLTLIDDASPDSAISDYFGELDRRGLAHLRLLRNAENMGFVGTANRAMTLGATDVVLLNSDTRVTEGWLGKLARCVASDRRIGTATPFSNNAEICSLPRFCENNRWPEGLDPEPMNRALEDAAIPTYPDLPTGVGFCLYIRRALIDEIGPFDPIFGLGYGEENDFCMRAARVGWRNVLCEDALVLHLGNRSFEGKRGALAERNMQLLLQRHPTYLDQVRAFIETDPLRPLRELALSRYHIRTGPRDGVLHIIHGHGGGTEYHVRALIAASSEGFRHYLAIAVDDRWQVEEHVDGAYRSFDFVREASETWPDFVAGLCATFEVTLCHLHNISGCRDGLLAAFRESDIPYGYTVHDLNFACPTITFLASNERFCGGETRAAVCRECLAQQKEFSAIDIEDWRTSHASLIARASFLIAPSRWASEMLDRYFPRSDVTIIPHGRPELSSAGIAPIQILPLPDDDVPTVAVIGAIGPDKGARRLERLIAMTREKNVRLRWVLIGYLDCQQQPTQTADAVFTVHGRYDPSELPSLLDRYRVRLVAYPSAGPETFSFTLSEAWAAGRPVIVPPIGALAERVTARGGGWIFSAWQDEWAMLDDIVRVLSSDQSDAFAAAVSRAREVPKVSLEQMALDTATRYRQTLSQYASRTSMLHRQASFNARRCNDALGNREWRPLPISTTAPDAASSDTTAGIGPVGGGFHNGRSTPRFAHTLARFGLSIRHTVPGRIMYRLAPERWVRTLKSKL